MRRIAFSLAFALAVTSGVAAHAGAKMPVAGKDFDVVTRDNPAAQRFELTFTSHAKRPICLAPEQWPNQAGKIDWARDSVAVRVGTAHFPLSDWNGGYCVGGCVVAKVRRGESVNGFIPYKDFEGFGAEQYQARKELVFPPSAFWCSH